ncbi:MAG TPA: CRTAC1 family protein [Chthonomonadaceae bacterium]|nr:CRTAC1 family protein [Chthonomonadaceae bacterium]
MAGALALFFVFGCGQKVSRHHQHPLVNLTALSSSSDPGFPSFREVGPSAGLHYRWEIPGKRPLNILQTIGNGCAFLDYNNDGNLDILLVGPKLALYRGDGQGHFTDVTQETGLDRFHGHFLGCAVGDYDNDGYDDLYISGYRTGLLLHNEGGRSFRDVARQMGLKPQPWGASCGFADLDGDGYLDFYVTDYVRFDPTKDLVLCPFHGVLTGCGPNDYDPLQGVLFHNEQGKRFREVTRMWHADSAHGKGLGVAFADFENTGHVGFAVANDLVAGDLFENTGRKRLKNIGMASGTAVDPVGDKHAGMGVDWGDYDNDGKLDLFVTTFGHETKCLYHNEGGGVFTYQSEQAKLDTPTLPYVAWGCKFFDADNDGWLDLMITNGHVQDNIRRFEKTTYREPTLFLHNRGGKHPTFEDATRRSGLGRLQPIVGRGLAVGDYDNDGRVDALVVDSEGRPLLLHNETQVTDNSWIGFRLIGTGRSNRDAYGAIVTVVAGGITLVRQCQPSGSYLSSSDPRVHFGLGVAAIQSVTIRWPDGQIQKLPSVTPGRYRTVIEGQPPK